MEKADIGVTGLATMGRNLARNLARHGFTVAVHNRTGARTEQLVREHGDEGAFRPAATIEEFVGSLERPRRAIIMVKAGEPTDAVIEELTSHMEAGDVIVDGGNAHFQDTRRREAALRERGLHYVGAGISGGEEGALNGPSIMPGGEAEAYKAVGPQLEAIAAKVDGAPCCVHVGPDGAGHFVKMVHNGIEYADMQLIGESYDLLRQALGLTPAQLAEIFREWNSGDLESYLIEITAEVLGHTDAATGRPFVDVVVDQAEQKGTGRWTVQSALDLGVPVTGIAEAVFARSLSGHPEQREAARALPGPHGSSSLEDLAEDVRRALYASKIVAYAQGFDQIAAANGQYGWDIDLGAMAEIWRGGCIIRARFLDRIKEAYEADPALPTLLADPTFTEALADAQDSWRRVVATAAAIGVPTPGFSSALAYYDALRRERLPAALVQGLRDFFGAHTYQRADREGTFHTDWSGDRTEEQA
jgi:6-phosphogluconate dehydrogenase